MKYYAITVKENSIPYEKLTEEVYVDWRNNAESKGLRIIHWTYEYDEKWRLHMHAIASSPVQNLWKRKFEMKNYHQHIDLLNQESDIINWMMYMKKDYTYAEQRDRFLWIVHNSGIDV